MTYHFPDYIPKRLEGIFYRIDSHFFKSRAALDTLVAASEDSKLLVEMIDASKSEIHHDEFNLDNLLSSPFRNPPFERGSRFASRYEPSLFYASLDQRTCMAEVAFHRLVFFHSTEEPLPNTLKTEHVLFSSTFLTNKGLDLTEPPFSIDKEKLNHQSDYSFTQSLGGRLRKEKKIDCFLYESSRDPTYGINIAFFNSKPFKKSELGSSSLIISHVTEGVVTFFMGKDYYRFSKEQFTDEEGSLPFPIC